MIGDKRIGIVTVEGTEKLAVFSSEEDIHIVDQNSANARQALDKLIKEQSLVSTIERYQSREKDFYKGEFRFETPIGHAEKIICIGVNYPSRNEEYKDGQKAPENPSIFIRFPRSFVGHKQNLIRPKVSQQLDYEGELTLVISKQGRHIPVERAHEFIAGLTIANEGTLRDWVRHAKFNVTQGKNFDKSGAIGPWLVPFETKEQIDDVRLRTFVNDELRQDDHTARMIFPIPYLIHYISTFTTLMPGDVILTGTPTGAGARFDPPRWLKPGDRIEIDIQNIGRLVNGVEDER